MNQREQITGLSEWLVVLTLAMQGLTLHYRVCLQRKLQTLCQVRTQALYPYELLLVVLKFALLYLHTAANNPPRHRRRM